MKKILFVVALLVANSLAIAPSFGQAACPNDLILVSTADDWLTGTYLMSTNVSVTASNKLSGSANVRYYAGSWIQLKSGFSAKCTSFQARIQACPPFSSEQADDRAQSPPDAGHSEIPWPNEQANPANAFTFFPNPTSGALTLRFDTSPDGPMLVRLADIQGKILHSAALPAGSMEFVLGIADLPPGIYLLGVQQGDGQMIYRKVVKQ